MQQKIRILLSVNALVGLAFGAALLLVPAALLHIYGLTVDGTSVLVARLLGVEFLGLNVLTWIARKTDPYAAGSAARAAVRAHLVSESAGALVSAWGAAEGIGNPMVWGVPVFYFAFAAAFLWAELALRRP